MVSTYTISVNGTFGVEIVSSHLVIETSLCKSALIVCLKLVRDCDVKIPLLFLVRFACQEACHLFVLLDTEHISEVKYGLFPVSVFAMRTGGERDWLVACSKLDVKPSNQGVYEIDPPNVEDIGGLERKVGGGNGVEVNRENPRGIGHAGFHLYRIHQRFRQRCVLQRRVVEAVDIVPNCTQFSIELSYSRPNQRTSDFLVFVFAIFDASHEDCGFIWED